MIAALAGRRIDAEEATEPRFPAENIALVASRIRSTLRRLKATTLVCAAARGADLLALQAAGELGIRRRIVLPSDPEIFRATSVVDGPTGSELDHRDWGEIFDRTIESAQAQGDLAVEASHASGQESYLAANLAILDQAGQLAERSGEKLIAIVVWNLNSRGPDDVTAAFREEAQSRHIAIEEISTLESKPL